jgi:hypothetical protein
MCPHTICPHTPVYMQLEANLYIYTVYVVYTKKKNLYIYTVYVVYTCPRTMYVSTYDGQCDVITPSESLLYVSSY